MAQPGQGTWAGLAAPVIRVPAPPIQGLYVSFSQTLEGQGNGTVTRMRRDPPVTWPLSAGLRSLRSLAQAGAGVLPLAPSVG